MSIQEKKSSKGTPYAIIKFSDQKEEFELFLFAETLVSNREKLKESESFIISLHKDKIFGDNTRGRVNVKKILRLEEVINKPYEKVVIELKENFKIDEIKKILSLSGDTEVQIVIKDRNKKVYYSLQKNRKFEIKHFKALKAMEYVAKIIV